MNTKLEDFILEFEALLPQLNKFFHAGGLGDLADLDITLPQFIALNVVFHKKDPKMSDIAEFMNVTMGNVTSLMDRLIDQSYVERAHDTEDRRVVRVKLTSKGAGLMKKANDMKRKKFTMIFSNLSDSDRSDMLSMMKKLLLATNTGQEGEKLR